MYTQPYFVTFIADTIQTNTNKAPNPNPQYLNITYRAYCVPLYIVPQSLLGGIQISARKEPQYPYRSTYFAD